MCNHHISMYSIISAVIMTNPEMTLASSKTLARVSLNRSEYSNWKYRELQRSIRNGAEHKIPWHDSSRAGYFAVKAGLELEEVAVTPDGVWKSGCHAGATACRAVCYKGTQTRQANYAELGSKMMRVLGTMAWQAWGTSPFQTGEFPNAKEGSRT